MSVVGIDFGNDTSKIAIVRSGGIEVILNDISKRETPSMVGFGSQERNLGEMAASSRAMNAKNTVTDLKRLLGANFVDPGLQEELEKFAMYQVSGAEDGGVMAEVKTGTEQKAFGASSLAAMLFVKLKAMTEGKLAAAMTDCVVGVPGFFTDRQRRALLDALKIADVKCLRLMNELTAVALDYGFYKQDLDEKEARKVMFVDMGHAHFQVAVVSFWKNKLQVTGYAYDDSLGGRDLTNLLTQHYTEHFAATKGFDVRERPRSLLRLQTSCEKVKKVMTTNPQAFLAIECLMNDMDVKETVQRDDFEAMAQPLLERMLVPIQSAMEQAGVTPDDLFAVELLGGSTRVKCVQETIQAAVGGKSLSNTMHKTESVCRGCALNCAMMSPNVRVREYTVEDVSPHPVGISFAATTGEIKTSAVFAVNNPIPSAKSMTFYRSSDFAVTATYDEEANPQPSQPAAFSDYEIGGFPAEITESDDVHKVKIKVKLDDSGVVRVTSAFLEIAEEVEADADADAEADAAAGGEGEGEGEGEKKKKVKKRRVHLTVTERSTSMTEQQMMEAQEQEADLALKDRIIKETADARNAVESYVYDMRSRLREGEPLAAFLKDDVRVAFISTLNDTEDWLYEDGEDAKKQVYVDKLAELQTVGGAAVKRQQEANGRDTAVTALTSAIATHVAFLESDAAQYAHISEEDKAPLAKAVQEAQQWITTKLTEQAGLPIHADPAFLCRECDKKARDLEKTARPIRNKPKPKPKEEPKPAPEAGEDNTAPDAAAAEGHPPPPAQDGGDVPPVGDLD